MFNGTNSDDRQDKTRLGLVAADNFGVASPLAGLSKDEVRALAKEMELENWNHAASPCLRSRLAFGVEATQVTASRSVFFRTRPL
jgi:PP-loop superfamily ATP-utilizing enzyme